MKRILILITAPEVTSPGTFTRQRVESVDIFPTLAELADLPAREGPQSMDGLSLVPVLLDPAARVRSHSFHAYPQKKLGRAIRTERYRLVESKQFGQDRTEAEAEAEYELDDYETDPLETKNLASNHPDVVSQLMATLARYPVPVFGTPARRPGK